MDKTLGIDCTTQRVQEVGRMAKRRQTATRPEIRVIGIRPETPNLEALESVYQILAASKPA